MRTDGATYMQVVRTRQYVRVNGLRLEVPSPGSGDRTSARSGPVARRRWRCRSTTCTRPPTSRRSSEASWRGGGRSSLARTDGFPLSVAVGATATAVSATTRRNACISRLSRTFKHARFTDETDGRGGGPNGSEGFREDYGKLFSSTLFGFRHRQTRSRRRRWTRSPSVS